MKTQDKGEVEQKKRLKKEPKDNRNFYLANKGIIREGKSKPALPSHYYVRIRNCCC